MDSNFTSKSFYQLEYSFRLAFDVVFCASSDAPLSFVRSLSLVFPTRVPASVELVVH